MSHVAGLCVVGVLLCAAVAWANPLTDAVLDGAKNIINATQHKEPANPPQPAAPTPTPEAQP